MFDQVCLVLVGLVDRTDWTPRVWLWTCGVEYAIDFERMVQRNVSTGRTRPIRHIHRCLRDERGTRFDERVQDALRDERRRMWQEFQRTSNKLEASLSNQKEENRALAEKLEVEQERREKMEIRLKKQLDDKIQEIEVEKGKCRPPHAKLDQLAVELKNAKEQNDKLAGLLMVERDACESMTKKLK